MRILIHTPEGVEFRPGMSVTTDIETETKTNVLAVPIQSVTVRAPKTEKPAEAPAEGEAQLDTKKKEKAKPEVQEVIFVVKDGKVKTVPVKRGISDDTHVEITEGAEEGMEVVSGPYRAINRELENGSAVRVENKGKAPTGPPA